MGFTRVVVLSAALLAGTAIAAALPLWLKLPVRHLRMVSHMSVGVLVGAALTVVIPEGVAAVFEASEHGDAGHHDENASWVGAALLAGFILMYLIDSLHGHDEYPNPQIQRPSYRSTPSHLAELEPLSHGGSRNSNDFDRAHDWEETGGNGTTIGVGGGEAGRHSHGHSPLSAILGTGGEGDDMIVADASAVSTVIGLLAHSLADGISLGASSLSSAASSSSSDHDHDHGGSGSSLQLIVFIAIMVHKAPTAFALSSLLTSSPATSPGFVRRALVLFSLAAPVGAVATYALLSLLGQGASEDGGASASLAWWTGLALVFSGGTFLFVATHAVREQDKKGEKAAEETDEARIGERTKLALILAGMVTPGLLSKLVGHGH
ncbi:hypothetical protein JCM10207_004834 [Rhodosporidiobolus poonsookiae]